MARARYSALPTSRGGGLVASTHSVKLNDGSNVSLTDTRRQTLVRASEPVNKAKVAVLNRLPQQEARFRAIMRRTIREFEKDLRSADNGRYWRSDGQMRLQTKKRLEALLDQKVRQAVKEMRENILSNIEGATRTYMRAVAQAHPDKIVAAKDINALARSIALKTYSQNVGGATASQRVAALGVRLERELGTLIGQTRDIRSEAKKRLEARLVDNKSSHSACVSKGAQRLNRTEQSRSMQKAAIEILKKSGAQFAYWRLSPAHKDYGGGEVCEVIASNTGPDVEDELAKAGISLPTEGLYLLSRFPETPHANCMCSVDIAL